MVEKEWTNDISEQEVRIRFFVLAPTKATLGHMST